ncbi:MULTISPECIES: sugar transferase [Nocardioides]|uniref:Sugar transferase n=1 Tax=Nocardioides vastitatis TaxID=2568655 RepID=A0ABW0ZFU3_9ACTN|nr:sugar transferase [Nocardioides sp.]
MDTLESSRVLGWTAPTALLSGDFAAAILTGVLGVQSGWFAASPVALGVLLALWVTCLVASHAADPSWVESRPRVCHHVVRAGCSLALTGTAATLVLADSLAPREVFVLAALWVALSCALRLAVASLGAGAARASRPLVVVGDGEQLSPHALATLERRVGGPVPVAQVVTDASARRPDVGVALGVGDVAGYARRVQAGAVVAIPGPGLDAASLRHLQWELEGIRMPFYVDPGMVGVASTRLMPVDVGGLSLVRIRAAQRRGLSWTVIGWAGRVTAAVGLAILLPALVLIAVAIRSTSPGPAIYRQVRVGQHGRVFTIYKFRTMVAAPRPTLVDNDFDDVLFKLRSDPRVTPLGRCLRRYSLDELPQLANVMLGHMRLVGPRPALPEEVTEYSEDARRRLVVKPGITGLWQVSGRSDLSWQETVRLDLHYVDNWSPWLDLAILCRTPGAIVGHRGAY